MKANQSGGPPSGFTKGKSDVFLFKGNPPKKTLVFAHLKFQHMSATCLQDC